MIEVIGDLWTYPATYRVITTNGDVRRDGACVMGRGCAKEAARKWPRLPYELGTMIHRYGNIVLYLSEYELFTFPVKHHWHERADDDLIRHSVHQLQQHLEPSASYVMPRPGCGNGGLRWEEVKDLLVGLPDNVHVIDFARTP